MKFHNRNIWTVVVGIPPLLMGGLLLYMAAKDVFVRGAQFSGSMAFIAGFGLFMFGLGWWLLFLGETVVLDFGVYRWRKTRGLFLPASMEGALSDFQCVEMGRVLTRRSDSGTNAYFWVAISAGKPDAVPEEYDEDDKDPPVSTAPEEKSLRIKLDSYGDFLKARELAETLAKALGRPLVDYTASPARIIPSKDLDRPAHRMKKMEVPPKPHPLVSHAEIQREYLKFTIPMGNPRKASLTAVAMFVLSAVLGGFFYHITKDMAGGAFAKAFCWAVFFLPSAIALGFLVAALWGSEVVQAEAGSLCVVRRLGMFRLRSMILAHEIEDVALRMTDNAEESKIVVRSDRKIMRFGEALPAQEKKWIAAMICNFYSTGT